MKTIFATFIVLSFSCSADWFGPKTYEDCVIDALKGTTSNVAAQEIKRACRTKFPRTPNLRTLTGDTANKALNNLKLLQITSHFSKVDHEVTFHNPLDLSITQITIAVKIDNTEPIFLKAKTNTKPLSMGSALFEIGLSGKSEITSWWVYEIEAYAGNPPNI